MNNNRRSFLKKISVAGAAAITRPGILAANGKENYRQADEPFSKTVLFQGDSITDGGRSYNQDWNHVYGQDYAYLITSRINFEHPDKDLKFFNRGISGNTVNDLAARWDTVTIAIKPDLLSILIGINDVFAVVIKGEKHTADDFAQVYDALLAKTVKNLPRIELVLCEPFILPIGMVKKDLAAWTAEVEKRQPIVKQLAQKYNAVYVPLQQVFIDAAKNTPADRWIWDGVHPMPAGHELIARQWLKIVSKKYRIS